MTFRAVKINFPGPPGWLCPGTAAERGFNTMEMQRCRPIKHRESGLNIIALTGRTDLYFKWQSNL